MADMGCFQTFQCHQTYILVFLIVILFPTVHADCPVNYPCFCRGKELICDNIGDVSQVPPFNPSSTIYEILKITHTPVLTTLQNNAFSGLKVKAIKLSYLGLTRIETEAFSGLDNTIETLDIIYTDLESLTDDVFNPVSKSLIELYLNNNHLTTLNPTLFSHLIKLEILCIDRNQLETISDGAFSNLRRLWFLTLDRNKLTTVMFSHITPLIYLFLSNNQLETISDDIFSNLTKLSSLFLDNTRITLSHTLFSRLTELILLDLSNNQLQTIPYDTFSNLRELETLYLNSNKLTALSPTVFNHLTQLKLLNLSNNQLETLPDDTFSNLGKLEILELYLNKLSTVSPTLFNHLTQLQWLSLSGNKLKTIRSDLFSSLLHLTHLDIANNPFICDCGLAWLKKSTLQTWGIIKDYPMCFSPSNVKGVGVIAYAISSRCYSIYSVITEPIAAVSDDDSVIQYVIIAAAGLVLILLVVGVTLYCRRKKNPGKLVQPNNTPLTMSKQFTSADEQKRRRRRQNASLEDIQPYATFEKEQSEIVSRMRGRSNTL